MLVSCIAGPTQRSKFMGLEFQTGPEALIPRPETELLCSKALELLSGLVQDRGEIRILEPCTGSGNLAIAIACREPRCRIYATDLSEPALELARRNAADLEVSERVDFSLGDLFSPLAPSIRDAGADLIVCNPPYISSSRLDPMPEELLKCGPRIAFDGGPFGLSVISRLIEESPLYLKPGSYLCFETGIGQGPLLAKMMRRMSEYSSVQIEFESATQTPVIIAQTRPSINPIS